MCIKMDLPQTSEHKARDRVTHAIPASAKAMKELIKEQDRLIQGDLLPKLQKLKRLEEKEERQRAFGKKGGRPKKKQTPQCPLVTEVIGKGYLIPNLCVD